MLLQIIQIYKEKEWEEKKPICKKKLSMILSKVLNNISIGENITNKKNKKILDKKKKLLNEMDKKEIENNDKELSKALDLFNNNKNFCNFKFSLKEIIFILFIIILLIISCHKVKKAVDIAPDGSSIPKETFNVFDEIFYFISNLLIT